MLNDLKINPAPLHGASNHSLKIDFIDRTRERARYFKRCGIKLAREDEVFLKVKVRAGAGKAEIKKIMEDGTIKIDLSSAPVRGRANKELVCFFARQFSIPEKNVKIISGLSNKIKLIRLSNNRPNNL